MEPRGIEAASANGYNDIAHSELAGFGAGTDPVSGRVQTNGVRQSDSFQECWAELRELTGRGPSAEPVTVEPEPVAPQPLQATTEVDTGPGPVEVYLSKAIKLAAEAGQWALVSELSGQLARLVR